MASPKHKCYKCENVFDTILEWNMHDCFTLEDEGHPGPTKSSLDKLAEDQEREAINPHHYKSSSARCACSRTIECIDIVRWLNMNIGNVIKYLWRVDMKGDRQEQLKKAHWYLRDEIRKKEPNFNAND